VLHEQSLVKQPLVAIGEGLELRALRVGLDMVCNQLHPASCDGVVVFVRCPVSIGDLLDPLAHVGDRRWHAISAYGEECEMDVLTVAESVIGTDDLAEDLYQLGIKGLGCVGYQRVSSSAVMTAWYPASCWSDRPASKLRSSSMTARST
jgi:hypothetical protein